MMQAKFYSLMANIHERNNSPEAAMKTLDETKNIRSRILNRVSPGSQIGLSFLFWRDCWVSLMGRISILFEQLC